MRILGIVAVILLGAAGLYYAAFVPLVAGHFASVGYGVLLLVAAGVVTVLLARTHRKAATGSAPPLNSVDETH